MSKSPIPASSALDGKEDPAIKLWFFGAFRTWGMARQFAGVYWNKTQNEALTPPGAERVVVRFTPWIDRPFDVKSSRWEWYDSTLGRLTRQTTPRNKFNVIFDNQTACNCGSTSAATMQEAGNGYRFEPNRFIQLTWSSPQTSRLLFDPGVGASISQWNQFWQTGVQADNARRHIASTIAVGSSDSSCRISGWSTGSRSITSRGSITCTDTCLPRTCPAARMRNGMTGSPAGGGSTSGSASGSSRKSRASPRERTSIHGSAFRTTCLATAAPRSSEVLKGWGVRDNNWEFSGKIQHELRPGLSLTGGYYRNTGGYYRNTDSKERVTNNILVGPDDFDQFCSTAPLDARLPNGGGYQVCGLSAIKPQKFGQRQDVVQPASDFGKDKRYNDLFAVGWNARLQGGIRVGGGFDTGRTVKDRCFVVDAPGLAIFSVGNQGGVFGPQTATTINGQQVCKIVTPFKAQTQVKLNGSVPLPAGFVVSGVYQDMSGPENHAIYAATNADILPSLGRNLAGGVRTVNVPLLPAQTFFEGRTRRLDLRLTKIFELTSRVRLQANFDADNALNGNAILSVNNTFGPRWRQPNTILDPRLLQFSGQLTF